MHKSNPAHILVLLLLIVSVCIGCGTGYQEVDGQWSYVTINEASGKKVKPLYVDPASFVILKNKNYAKDNRNVFYEGRIITEADANSFELIKGKYYAKDKNHVFLNSHIIINADPKSFSKIKFPYAKDDKNIYCGTIPMNVDRIDKFKVRSTSSMIVTMTKKAFIERNSDQFSFLDTIDVNAVVYGYGTAESKNQRFENFREIE